MTIDQFNSIFAFLQLSFLAKLFVIILSLFYVVFTVVVFRQISLMTQVLNSKISPVVKIIALLQIAAAILLLSLAVILS